MPRRIKIITNSFRSLNQLDYFLKLPPCTYEEARNKLLLCMFYYQGFKTSIVQKLKFRNYDLVNKILTIPIDNKGLKTTSIALEESTLLHLEYLVTHNSNPNSPIMRSIVFGKPADIPITIRQLQRVVKETLQKNGFNPKLNPRILRHFCGIRITKDAPLHISLDSLIGRVSPWVFTEYKRKAGNFRKRGEF